MLANTWAIDWDWVATESLQLSMELASDCERSKASAPNSTPNKQYICLRTSKYFGLYRLSPFQNSTYYVWKKGKQKNTFFQRFMNKKIVASAWLVASNIFCLLEIYCFEVGLPRDYKLTVPGRAKGGHERKHGGLVASLLVEEIFKLGGDF